MIFKNAKIEGMGSEEGSEFKLRTVDPERVKKMRTCLAMKNVKITGSTKK